MCNFVLHRPHYEDKTHRTEIERILERAKKEMGAIPAVSVSPTDCQSFIYSIGKQHHVQRKARAILGSVFTHAMRMGWLTFNPAGSLKLARRAHKDTVEIFNPEEAAVWLGCVANKAPSCLAGLSRCSPGCEPRRSRGCPGAK